MSTDFESREVLVAKIYTPVKGGRLASLIAPRSGIVGSLGPLGLTIYYEGNLNGASNLMTYEERVVSAAGRMFTGYPTSATMRLPPLPGEDAQGNRAPGFGELIPVGEVVWMPWSRRVFVDIRNMTEVAKYWNGES